jgi:hypothetical protein
MYYLELSNQKLPIHSNFSETCKDLISKLLKRNPEDRINFEQFFNHPFVDLDHMPSNECLPKAVFYDLFS